jgi:hypothetical protein
MEVVLVLVVPVVVMVDDEDDDENDDDNDDDDDDPTTPQRDHDGDEHVGDKGPVRAACHTHGPSGQLTSLARRRNVTRR